MENENTNLGLVVRGTAKDCYSSEQERLLDYSKLLSTSVNQGQAGSSGTQGAQGQQGAQGPPGPKGDKGDKGIQGEVGNVTVDIGSAIFDNGAEVLTVVGKDLTKASFSLYAVDQSLATFPANNKNTSISRVDLIGADTVIRISAIAVDETATPFLTSNLAVRWTLISTP